MEINRRFWLKQFGLGLAGVFLSNIRLSAAPVKIVNHDIKEAGNTDNPIILRSNENPYGPSPLAQKEFAKNSSISNRYNWNIASQLISSIATKNNVKEQNILLGAGSTEILDLAAIHAASDKGNYVIADPSYDYWTLSLDNFGLAKRKVSLSADKKLDLLAMREAIDQNTRLVYICNPNNPTGTILEKESLVSFIASIPSQTTVLVDEAYLDFTKEQSLCDLINNYPNLIIAKTFSKIYGLAGARIGYAVANKILIDKLASLQSNTNNSVSVLSKLAAIASLNDNKFISDCYSLNNNVRKYTAEELTKLNCRCIPSSTNFIYFSLADFGKDYFQLLDKNNIQGTRIYEEEGRWTRITVGTMEEMKRFIKVLQ